MSTAMTTPTKEKVSTPINREYEEAKRLFYSYCLMSIGISPNADPELIAQLMEENGYAIGTSEEGGTISFGKKRTEPTASGESYDILAQSDLHSFLLEHSDLKYKESLKLPAAQYAEMLDGIDYAELVSTKGEEIIGDLVSDNVLVFCANDDEFHCLGKGTISIEDFFFIDEDSYCVVDEDTIEDYRHLQPALNLPVRYFSQVFVGEGDPQFIDTDGVNRPTFQFKVNISDDTDNPKYVYGLTIQLPTHA